MSSSSSSAAARTERKGRGVLNEGKRRLEERSDQSDARKPQRKKLSDFDKLLKEVQDKMAAQRKGQGGQRGESEGPSIAQPQQHDMQHSRMTQSSSPRVYNGGGNDLSGGPSQSYMGGGMQQIYRGGRFGGTVQGGRGYSRRTPSREALVSRAVLSSTTRYCVV